MIRILFVLYIRRKKIKKILLQILTSMSIGSVLSLIVVGIAPGNINRAGYGSQPPPIYVSVLATFTNTMKFIPEWINNHTLISGVVFLIGMVLFFDPINISKKTYANIRMFFTGVIVITLAIIGAALSPSYIVRGFAPPERALIIPVFFVVLMIASLGLLSAITLVKVFSKKLILSIRWFVLILLLAGIVQGVIPSIRAGFDLIEPLKTYAVLWDTRHNDLLLASAEGEHVFIGSDLTKIEELHPLKTKLWITGDLETFPNHWINRCATMYYKLDEIYVE